MALRERTPAEAGALAAGLLVEACPPHPENSLRMQVVRDLALDLERRLEALADTTEGETDSLIEAALACADLATLAACNLSVLPDRSRARAAVHLASGTTRALVDLLESETAALEETSAKNTLRDARSAGWRADLAADQIEEA